MRLSIACLLLALSFAALARDARAPRYLTLINQAHGSVVSLSVRAHGAADFGEVPLDGALAGGGESRMVALRGPACRQDLRFAFLDGRRLRYENVDLCRYGRLHVRPLPRGQTGSEFVVSWPAPRGPVGALAGR